MHRGLYHGDLEGPGELERAVGLVARPADTVSRGRSELVLVHADHRRLRLLVNLVAQLGKLGLHNTLALGFSQTLCDVLNRTEPPLSCAHSSYLRTGPIAARVEQLLPLKHVAWLQRWHYLGRLAAMGVRVLALDTDMAVRADPFPALRDPALLGGYQLVTTFDFKGGFANTNIGFVCLQTDVARGPVHALFLEFEARVADALRLAPARRGHERAKFITQFIWDQNLFNKVLLSAMAGRAAYLPDGSDAAWSTAHRKQLRARLYWSHPTTPLAPPRWLAAAEPYFPRAPATPSPGEWQPSRFGALWTSLPTSPPAGALWRGSGCGNVSAYRYCGGSERVLLAPPWLVAMENGLGHKLKHVAYGATPSPTALIHFTCTTQTEAARIWPLRLYGYWHALAVRGAERAALAAGAVEVAAAGGGVSSGSGRGAPWPSPRLIALADGTLERPLALLPWATLNAMHGVLGALATLTRRSLVMPALNCTGVADGRLGAARLQSRCFWHLQPVAGQVRCVLRIGSCEEPALATPTELSERVRAMPRAPRVVSLNLAAPIAPAVVDSLDTPSPSTKLARPDDDGVLLVSLTLPRPVDADGEAERGGRAARDRGADRGRRGRSRLDPNAQSVLDAASRNAAPHSRLASELRAFRHRCSDVTRRAKGPNECNNICS